MYIEPVGSHEDDPFKKILYPSNENKIIKKIAIIAKTASTGSEFLIKMLDTLPYNLVRTIRKHGVWPDLLELNDGTLYIVIHPGERGWRWNKAFVQRSLTDDEKFMNYVVKAGFMGDFDIEYFD